MLITALECKILYLLHPNQNPLLNISHFHTQKIHLHSQRSLLAVSPATETTHEFHVAEQLGSWLKCYASDFYLTGGPVQVLPMTARILSFSVSPVFPSKCWEGNSNQVKTASFKILSSSLFSNNHFIHCYIIWTTILKYTVNEYINSWSSPSSVTNSHVATHVPLVLWNMNVKYTRDHKKPLSEA